MKRPITYAASIIFVIAMALLAYFWAIVFNNSLERYQTPFSLSQERVSARNPITKPLTDRVILVVADGLRPDLLRELPFLTALGTEGAQVGIICEEPNNGKSSCALLSSGAQPEINGIAWNSFQGRMDADNLFRRIREAELTADAAAHQWWREINGNYFSPESFFYATQNTRPILLNQQIFRHALGFIQHSAAQLLLVHFPDSPTVSGGSTKDIDRYVAGLATDIDLQRETLIVTSAQGPMLAIGKGINPGIYSLAPQVNLTATIAALLGIAPPTEAQGSIMWDILTAPAVVRAKLEQARGQVLADFVSSYVRTLGYARVTRTQLSEAALLLDESERFARASVYESAFQKARDAVEILTSLQDEVRQDALWRGRWIRLPLVLATLALFAYGISRFSLRQRLVILINALLYPLAFFFFYSALFHRAFSFSTFLKPDLALVRELIGFPAFLTFLTVMILTLPLRIGADKLGIPLPTEGRYWPACDDYLAGYLGIYTWLTGASMYGFLLTGAVVRDQIPSLPMSFFTMAFLQQIILFLPGLILVFVLPFIDGRIRVWWNGRDSREFTLGG